MKKLFIVANWKSYKTSPEAKEWLQHVFTGLELKTEDHEKEVIVAAPFTLLASLHQYITEHHLTCKLAAQDVSPFGQGAYTGEVTAAQIKEFADYVIIGHSERRKYFSETDTMLSDKVKQALMVGITPIFCVQGKETPIPQGVSVVAYEPVAAIGSGHPDTPENADEVARVVKENNTSVITVLYGGSVTADNVHNFTQMASIDGVLVGGASLEEKSFSEIIKNT